MWFGLKTKCPNNWLWRLKEFGNYPQLSSTPGEIWAWGGFGWKLQKFGVWVWWGKLLHIRRLKINGEMKNFQTAPRKKKLFPSLPRSSCVIPGCWQSLILIYVAISSLMSLQLGVCGLKNNKDSVVLELISYWHCSDSKYGSQKWQSQLTTNYW